MSARYFEHAAHAALYLKFRPVTPPLLISRVLSFLQEKTTKPFKLAIDVGCGSGQSSNCLANHFTNVIGLDISEAQIEKGNEQNIYSNVSYKISPAESLPFEDESVQLITSGQACHWFDVQAFYQEANRILVPNGVIAVYCYNLPSLIFQDKRDELSKLLIQVYETTTPFWGKRRIHVDNGYIDDMFTLPYLDSVREDGFVCGIDVNLDDLMGYVSTWSGFQKYQESLGKEAAKKLLGNFAQNIKYLVNVDGQAQDAKLRLEFPYLLLMGRKPCADDKKTIL